MSNTKKNNKAEIDKLNKKQNSRVKKVRQIGKAKKQKQTIAPDANVTIKPRAVKIKPAA